MKKRINTILLLAVCLPFLSGCSDWLNPEAEKYDETNLGTLRDAAYYAGLREWKSDPDRRHSFVWFDNWIGGTSGAGSLSGLPDSLTIASNWGQPKWPLTDAQLADMKFVQQTKGTKVVVTILSQDIGVATTPASVYSEGYEGYTGDAAYNIFWDIHRDMTNPALRTTDADRLEQAIRKYAKSIYDSVVKWGYDGYDWDYEPQGGGGSNKYLWVNQTARKIFVDELTYWFGPGSQRINRGGRPEAKPGLLLQIDGEIGVRGNIDRDWPVHLIDHYILQAYACYGESDLNGRVNGVLNIMSDNTEITDQEKVKRIIVTENFESYANTGGPLITMPDGSRLPSLLFMAGYVYKQREMDVQIGGFGVYRIGFDYNNPGKEGDYLGSPEYHFLRRGMTIQNLLYLDRQKVE